MWVPVAARIWVVTIGAGPCLKKCNCPFSLNNLAVNNNSPAIISFQFTLNLFSFYFVTKKSSEELIKYGVLLICFCGQGNRLLDQASCARDRVFCLLQEKHHLYGK